tara:strand:- start:3692 stop:4768 length:1077 start_codon:yes stop_codon:yes gene_type:complete
MRYKIIIVTNNYFPNEGGITTYLNFLNLGLNSLPQISSSVLKIDYSKYSNTIIRYYLLTISLINLVITGFYYKIIGYNVIIHSHSANYCLLFSYISKRLFANKALHTFHSPIDKPDFILKKFTHKLDKVGYVSNQTKELYKKLETPDNKNEFILPGGIDLKDFLNEKNYVNTHKKKSLLFVGRISKEKGVLESIKSVEKIIDDIFEYNIVGGFKTEEQKKYFRLIQDYIHKKKLSKKIILCGSKYDKELIGFYKKSDIFLLPSIWEEPAPMVIAEAFAASLPIIAFDVGGLSERIQTNKNGLLVEPNNIDLFAETISELISDTNKYQKLSMDAISTAKTKFNLENMISDHLKFYGISK